MSDSEIRMTKIEMRLDTAEKASEELSHELFGNGQPGRFDKIEAQLNKIHDKLGKIITVVGVLAAASGGATATFVQALL
jgi:hypothetical protein